MERTIQTIRDNADVLDTWEGHHNALWAAADLRELDRVATRLYKALLSGDQDDRIGALFAYRELYDIA